MHVTFSLYLTLRRLTADRLKVVSETMMSLLDDTLYEDHVISFARVHWWLAIVTKPLKCNYGYT